MLAVTWAAVGVLAAISIGFMAMVKSEIGGLRLEMRSGDEALRTALTTEVGGLRAEMQIGFASLEGRLDRRIDKLDATVDALDRRIDSRP